MGLRDPICVLYGGPVAKQAYDKWLGDLYIITSKEDIVKTDDSKEDLPGEYIIKGKIYNIYPSNWHFEIGKKNDYIYGIVCHKNCYKLIYKSLKHKILFANVCRSLDRDGYIKPKSKYGIIIKYWWQFFDYELAEKKNEWVLKNPLSNAKNKTRILKM
uniref:Uncharacterized protein n=1 Tax=Mimivirus LCMiAC02 TaxID=2506609 RepID=A0A4D5XF01_9VIRU|nr:MAG: hypothetical protein LCMiAC02_04240 [Mimivirus LCMiAC02]